MLFQLHFREYDFKVKEAGGKKQIFDIIRKKFLVITPEEWVRQNLLHYLIFDKMYNRNFIALEYQLVVNNLQKRCDIVVFNTSHQPQIIIECKRPDIMLNNEIFQQAARYNLTLQVPYLIISNGIDNIAAKVDFQNENFQFLNEYPKYLSL